MPKNSKLQEQYTTNAEMMDLKSRFEYFNILPSHTAAITDDSSSKRMHMPIQPGETQVRRWRLNIGIYTQGLRLLAVCERIISLILLLPSMVRPTEILPMLRRSWCCKMVKNGKVRRYTNPPCSIRHFIPSFIKNQNALLVHQLISTSKLDAFKYKEFKYTKCL